MPAVGLGAASYRHIDTAAAYLRERAPNSGRPSGAQDSAAAVFMERKGVRYA